MAMPSGREADPAKKIDMLKRIFLAMGISAVVVKALHGLTGDLNALGLSPPEAEHNHAHNPRNNAGPCHPQNRNRPHPLPCS